MGLLKKSKELLEQSKVFKKRTNKLTKEMGGDVQRRYTKYATVGVAYIGGAAACFVCPPAGAVILSGAGCVTVCDLLFSSVAGVDFWGHKFGPIRVSELNTFRDLWTRKNKGRESPQYEQ